LAAFLHSLAKRHLVQVRRAGSDHHAVEIEMFHVLDDQVLSRIGAHILVLPRHGHTGELARALHDGLYIDLSRDVGPTVADVNTDFRSVFSVAIHGRFLSLDHRLIEEDPPWRWKTSHPSLGWRP